MSTGGPDSLDPELRTMLTWTLANELRRAWGSGVAIGYTNHWYEGLSLVDTDSDGLGVLLSYQEQIYLQRPDKTDGQLPNACDDILRLPPNVVARRILDELLGEGRRLASHSSGSESVTAERRRTWDVAYGLVEALLRLSVQRGFGWRYQAPFSYYGLNWNLLAPYKSFHTVTPQEAGPLPIVVGSSKFDGEVSDWSFITDSHDLPVCAVDPSGRLMLPDGSAWSLATVEKTASWKVAAAVAASTNEKHDHRSPNRLDLTHALAGAIPIYDLLAHNAAGGRVVDHHLYGPLPILKSAAVTMLKKSTGRKIPADALAWPRPSQALLAQAWTAMDYEVSKDPFRGDHRINLLITWTQEASPTSVLLLVGPEDVSTFPDDLLPGWSVEVDPVVIASDLAARDGDSLEWRLGSVTPTDSDNLF